MNRIRLARPADASSILDIYTPYIHNTAVTFETEVPEVDSFAQRIDTCFQNWPWLVAEVGGVLAGYAYATRHRDRAAYQWCVESSVYVHDDFHKKGIATALYAALFQILHYQGCRNVYAGITLPNDTSVAFHKSTGFSWLADYDNIGYKLNKWNTVSWWQLRLNELSLHPDAPLKLPGVEPAIIEKICSEQATKIKG